jgi:hypothetical protein
MESLFTASLHLSDFVQTQNEAKILTNKNMATSIAKMDTYLATPKSPKKIKIKIEGWPLWVAEPPPRVMGVARPPRGV